MGDGSSAARSRIIGACLAGIVATAGWAAAPRQLAAQTARAREVYSGQLPSLLKRVSALLDTGFDSAAVDSVSRAALRFVPRLVRNGSTLRQETPPSPSWRYAVRYRGRVTDVVLRLELASDLGYHDVVFTAADARLLADIRAAIRADYLASLAPIDSGFVLRLGEYVSSVRSDDTTGGAPPALVLSVTTVRTYGCVNLSIEMETRHERSSVILDLLGMARGPKLCLTALGPARGWIRLPWSPGRYTVVVRYRGSEDVYAVDLTPSAIVVQPRRQSFTRFPVLRMARAPRRSFAVHWSANASHAWVLEEFRRTMERSIPVAEFRFPSGFEPPFGRRGGSQDTSAVRYYRYQSEQDFDRLRGVLCDFARRVPDAPGKMNWSIEAVNWLGETRFSWRCADKPHDR